MENYLSILNESKLFLSIEHEEIKSLLNCLSATVKTYEKNEYIFNFGDDISTIGVVLQGSVHITKEDYWGNNSIISEVPVGAIFGESYACMRSTPLTVNAISSQKSKIMFLNVMKIATTCSSACNFHTRLICNLVELLADHNFLLTNKIGHISQRTTKEKLLSYLFEQSQKRKSNSFEIPFNRQQLADFLSVDRSAMSNELCKLRDEGILKFDRNHFELIMKANTKK